MNNVIQTDSELFEFSNDLREIIAFALEKGIRIEKVELAENRLSKLEIIPMEVLGVKITT